MSVMEMVMKEILTSDMSGTNQIKVQMKKNMQIKDRIEKKTAKDFLIRLKEI